VSACRTCVLLLSEDDCVVRETLRVEEDNFVVGKDACGVGTEF
jgi:hypothetical protein